MGYKKNTKVITIPVSQENHDKLETILYNTEVKNKTQLAKTLLEEAIENEYRKLKIKK